MRSAAVLRSVVALVLAVELAASADPNVNDGGTSKLRVHIPRSLNKPGGYEHRRAKFGFPSYSGSITQTLVYAGSDLCRSYMDAPRDSRGRQPDEPRFGNPPFILMLDRGECSFIQQVRNGQHAGASAVIVAEDCVDRLKSTKCRTAEPSMVDDGSGGDVTVPSFLVRKDDADAIKAQLSKGHPVQLEMSWALNPHTDFVTYEVWSDLSDPRGNEFLVDFRDIAKALGDKAEFKPHIEVYDGINAGCRNSENSEQCKEYCTNGNRYCVWSSSSDGTGIPGSDKMVESLRRLCIWEHYGKNGIGEQWWKYVVQFHARCNNPDDFRDMGCIRDCYETARIDSQIVDTCMYTSGWTDDNGINALLDRELRLRNELGMQATPMITVNSVPIRGQLDASSVLSKICERYSPETLPEVCAVCVGRANVKDCVKSGEWKNAVGVSSAWVGPKKSVSFHTVAITLLLLSAAGLAVGAWQSRKGRQEMREQVRGLLADYIPLEGQ